MGGSWRGTGRRGWMVLDEKSRSIGVEGGVDMALNTVPMSKVHGNLEREPRSHDEGEVEGDGSELLVEPQ